MAAVYARPQLPSLNFGGGHHDINPVYRADGQVFVNQHAYGIPAAHSPVFCYRESESGELATAHLAAQALTEQAQHRPASIPDLIVAATARARSLEILHYVRDFDTIARCTEQPARWIVPPGTV